MRTSSDLTLTLPKTVLLLGEPGSGKTTLSLQFPKPFVLDVDSNLVGPKRYLTLQKKTPTFSYAPVLSATEAELKAIGVKDLTNFTRSGSDFAVPREWRYRLAAHHLDAAVQSPDVESIIISSWTTFDAIIQDEVRRQYSLPFDRDPGKLTRTVDKRPDKDGFALWSGYLSLAKNLIIELKSTTKRLVVEAHIAREKTSDSSMIEKIAIPGQLGDTIAGYFEEVWRLETTTDMKAGSVVSKRIVRTQANPDQLALGLKSAAQLPKIVTLDADELFKAFKVS